MIQVLALHIPCSDKGQLLPPCIYRGVPAPPRDTPSPVSHPCGSISFSTLFLSPVALSCAAVTKTSRFGGFLFFWQLPPPAPCVAAENEEQGLGQSEGQLCPAGPVTCRVPNPSVTLQGPQTSLCPAGPGTCRVPKSLCSAPREPQPHCPLSPHSRVAAEPVPRLGWLCGCLVR